MALKSLLVFLCLLLVGCVAPTSGVKHVRQPWEPEQFEYRCTALMGGQDLLRWDGACLVEHSTRTAPLPGVRPEKDKIVRYHPTQAQWEAFWKDAEHLKLPKWRKSYRPEDIGWSVDDGMTWSFRARNGSMMVDTSGENAGPALPDVSRTRVIGGAWYPTKELTERIEKLKTHAGAPGSKRE